MKLRQKLILLFIGVTVSLSAITSGIMFFQTKKSLDRKVVEYVSSIASNKAEYIDIFITDFKHKVKDMGNMSVINNKNVNEVVREFSGLVKNDDRIHTAYVGYADGLTIKNDGAMDPKNYNPLEKDWYKQAVKANGDIIVTNPYIDAFTGEKIITLSKAVGNNTVVALDIRLDTIFNAINKTKIGTTGYAILISGDGTVIYHPTQEYVDGGKNIKDLDDWGKDALTNMSGQLKSVNASKEESQIAYCKAKESGWVVAAILPESEYNADMKSGIKIDIAVVLLMVTASGALTIFILNKLIKDLDIVRDNMKEVEQGRLDIETKITRNDEIGEIERSFNNLTNSVRDMFSGVVGASDKTVNIVNNLRDIQGKNAEVNKVVGESVESIVVACENNSSSVEEINASMEELMSLQEQMAGDINELKDNSKETVTMAIEGASKVDSSVESMVEIDKATQAMHEIVTTLAEHSKNIDKIVDNISDISAQTNLLALNASIEAARAGDAGKGFSVVADEVRKLAEQSEASTDNISSILKEVLDGIETAVKSVENKLRLVKKGKDDAIEAKQYIQDIKNKINDLDNNIENINQKSSEQCVYIEEVGKATENVSESLEESVRMAEEIRNIRDSQDENISIMNDVVDELDKSSKELKNSTNKFIL